MMNTSLALVIAEEIGDAESEIDQAKNGLNSF